MAPNIIEKTKYYSYLIARPPPQPSGFNEENFVAAPDRYRKSTLLPYSGIRKFSQLFIIFSC